MMNDNKDTLSYLKVEAKQLLGISFFSLLVLPLTTEAEKRMASQSITVGQIPALVISPLHL